MEGNNNDEKQDEFRSSLATQGERPIGESTAREIQAAETFAAGQYGEAFGLASPLKGAKGTIRGEVAAESNVKAPLLPGGAGKNLEHAGAAAKGYPGVKMTANGLGPDFAGTKFLKTDLAPGQRNSVKIKLQGSRYQDFKEANGLAGFKGAEPPEGYTWHHLADYDPATGEGTMQLVDKAAHRATYPHKGSVYQYEQATGQTYR